MEESGRKENARKKVMLVVILDHVVIFLLRVIDSSVRGARKRQR